MIHINITIDGQVFERLVERYQIDLLIALLIGA